MEHPFGVDEIVRTLTIPKKLTVAYVSFVANSAAAQASILAITGASPLEWTKVCNIYTRFCEQIAGGILCGYAASLIMAVVSSLSAFNLYRLYSSQNPSLDK
eukprot:TRINITY_DN2493_c0_g1_i3.p1 TRINITY_DN2493_c0_g1~~TRINITY_DN2493_c0_g1_i3.p1  ORF type:complete len:102 (+),score=3.69 TRINITY_DN2493_c0_g1_i3:56-361(+)